MSDEDPEPEVYIVHLERRSLPSQVEYLINQVSFLVARVGTLERDVEKLHARLRSVERATPWTAPKTGPPSKPAHVTRSSFTHNYDEAMSQLEAEVEKIRRRDEDDDVPGG